MRVRKVSLGRTHLSQNCGENGEQVLGCLFVRYPATLRGGRSYPRLTDWETQTREAGKPAQGHTALRAAWVHGGPCNSGEERGGRWML